MFKKRKKRCFTSTVCVVVSGVAVWISFKAAMRCGSDSESLLFGLTRIGVYSEWTHTRRAFFFTARSYASAVLAMALCLSVRLSVTSRCSTKTAERIELVFGMWASFHPSYTVLIGNSVISKNKGTSPWNFVLKSGFRKFRHGISIVETCYQLSSRKVDAQSVINWAVVGQLSR